eukprot:1438932-Amphidinium_carterae.1
MKLLTQRSPPFGLGPDGRLDSEGDELRVACQRVKMKPSGTTNGRRRCHSPQTPESCERCRTE